MLLRLGSTRPYRATRDLDLLRRGEATFDAIRVDLEAILPTTPVPDDGITFDPAGLVLRPMQADVVLGDRAERSARAFVIAARRQLAHARLTQRTELLLNDLGDRRIVHRIVFVTEHVTQAPNTSPRDLWLTLLDHRAELLRGFADPFEAPLHRVLSSSSASGCMPFKCARARSMLVMMSCSRARGTSEGIHRLRLCGRTHMRTEAVAPGDVDVLPHDSFEVGRYSSVREKVVGDTGGEIDEQVHVAVGSLLRTHDRTEHCDVDNAALTKFDFVGAELREDVREERHEKNLLPKGLAYNVTGAGPMIEILDDRAAAESIEWCPRWSCTSFPPHCSKYGDRASAPSRSR